MPDKPFPMQLETISFGEDVFFRVFDELISAGVLAANDLRVLQNPSGADMSCNVDVGEAYVSFTSPVYGGKRQVHQSITSNSGRVSSLNSAEWLSSFVTADATKPRIDRVVVTIKDSSLDNSGLYAAMYQVVAGVATVGATLVNLSGAAAVPANSLLLANVLIPAAATTVTTANIDTTVRARATAGGGTMLVSGVPTGGGIEWYAAAAPSGGWLLQDGSAISRATYSTLFGVISTTYGVGDGSTTFNLPDQRGRVAVCYAASGGHADVSTLNNKEGSNLADRRPKHPHADTIAYVDTGHVHQIPTFDNSGGGQFASNGLNTDYALHTSPLQYSNTATAALSKSGSVGAAGVANDAPAYIVVNKIIKT